LTTMAPEPCLVWRKLGLNFIAKAWPGVADSFIGVIIQKALRLKGLWVQAAAYRWLWANRVKGRLSMVGYPLGFV